MNCTLAEAEAEFVPAYNPSKPTRRGKIWLAYQNYLNDLRQIIGTETNFFQWLDGSFIGVTRVCFTKNYKNNVLFGIK